MVFPSKVFSILPQLSKCLKFEAVRGGITLIKGFEFEQTKKTHECIVVHRMAHHNVLID